MLRCCLSVRNLVRTAAIAAVVGTGLFAINQLDVVVSGHASARVWLKLEQARPWADLPERLAQSQLA